ncbi:MAG: low molecular weight protein arginine phosphatase [Anaerolineaceae bacterium]|nr:low molecular weight protein arginine phosphatase [Anaerolineaceae bacterium]
MAAALFSVYLQKTRPDWQDWLVESAGTWAVNGKTASKNSQIVMTRRKLDIRKHRSRIVTSEMLAGSDLIITMETGHKEALCLEFPFVAARVFLLNEMVGNGESIKDPYGGTLQEYEETASLLENVIEKGMDRILSLVEHGEPQ